MSRFLPKKQISSKSENDIPFSLTELADKFKVSDSTFEDPETPKGESQQELIVRNLLESCSNMIGSNFSPVVALSTLDVIMVFAQHLTDKELLPFVAKVFQVFMRRFNDKGSGHENVIL